MASKAVIVGLAATVGVAAGVLVGFGIFGDDATNTNIVLATSNSAAPCTVASKEQIVQSRVNKKVRWWIRDFTCNTPGEVVTLGNFRTTEASGNGNCEAATEAGAVWPFNEPTEPQHRRANPAGKIELKIRNDSSLPAVYYYDVCTGTGTTQVKADPRLVIDR